LLLSASSHNLLSPSSILAREERVAIPICCNNGRKVAKEAQMQPKDTSMKLQMLRGTIESTRHALSLARKYTRTLQAGVVLTSEVFRNREVADVLEADEGGDTGAGGFQSQTSFKSMQ
jgi:hypothetical protein